MLRSKTLRYSASCGAALRECNVSRVRMKAATAHTAMVVTIGRAVPSKNALATTIITAPVIICSVPPSAEAMPAIGP